LVSSGMLFICSAPILIYHFFELPLIGLLLNFLIIPIFSTLFLPFLLFVFLLSFVFSGTTIFQVLISETNHILDWIEKGAERIAEGRFLTIVTGRLPLVGMLLVFLGIIFFWMYLEKERKYIRILLISIVF